jgi:uncharacterized protein (TIGR04442 family)
MIRGFLGNKRELDLLQRDFFEELFISGLFSNRYLSKYGRTKIITLTKGLKQIEENWMSTPALLGQLMAIDQEESLSLIRKGQA